MNVLLKSRERADNVPANAEAFNISEALSGGYNFITEKGIEVDVINIEIDPMAGRGDILTRIVDTLCEFLWFDDRGYPHSKNRDYGDLLMYPNTDNVITADVASIASQIEGIGYALKRHPNTPLKDIAKQLTALAIEIMYNNNNNDAEK